MSEPVEEVFYPNAFREEDVDEEDATTIELLAEGIRGNKLLLQEARSEICAARKCINGRSVWRDFVRKHFSF